MKTWHLVLAAGVGVLVGLQLRGHETGCCNLVALNVRDEVNSRFGSTFRDIGDALNIWGATVPLVQALGITGT